MWPHCVSHVFIGDLGLASIELFGTHYPIVLAAGGLIFSAGFYRILTIAIRWAMDRSTNVAKLVLGPNFVHGTWVGWFDGHSGERRYVVEHFSQDLDGLVITGRSFDIDLKEHGYWESEAAAIDAKRGKLIFTYKFDVLTRGISLFGIHTSYLARLKPHQPTTALSGFAHDLNDATRIAVHSKKIADNLAPWDSSLQQAIEFSAGSSKPMSTPSL